MTFAQPFKDYEILERLGAGAMGTVFKARQRRLDRVVALKVLKPSLARNAKFVERLSREARIVASLNHPGIVTGHDLGEEGGYHFFVMEYVDGKSLSELLKEWGAFPEQRVLAVATAVAGALEHAYAKGVIHRDVKPGNILIDSLGRAKLTDMGLAKAPEDASLTQEGAAVGTPHYISPEQARDARSADIRSDLYSLGATLYHMATGQPPFQGESLANVLDGVLHRRPAPPRVLNPALSPGLDLVIRKLMARDPALRYQTPTELLLDLHRVRRDERPEVDEQALLRADRPPGAARRRWPWLAAAGAALAAAALMFWLRSAGGGPAAADPVAVLVQRVRAELAETEGYRDKLRLLGRTAAAEPAAAAALDDIRSGLLISWRETLVGEVDERAAGLGDWIASGENWAHTDRYVDTEILRPLEQRYRISMAELPATVRQHLDTRLRELNDELQRRVAERDRSLLRSYEEYVRTEVVAAWREQLAIADFATAAAVVDSALLAYFAPGTGRPRRDQLDDRTAEQVAAVDAAARTAAATAIAATESQAALALEAAAESAVQAFRAQLERQDDPRFVRDAYRGWRRGLVDRHPPASAFRPGRDPWRRVDEAAAALESELLAAIRAAEHRRLQEDFDMALGALLVDGVAGQEIRWLASRPFEAPEVGRSRDRAAELLAGADAAAQWLLAAQPEGGRPFRVADAVAIGRQRLVSVRLAADGRVELLDRDEGGRPRPLSLAAVRVSELLARTGVQAAAELRPGLALWLYLAGENRLAAEQLDDRSRALFGDWVVPAVSRTVERRLGQDAEARAALAALRDYRSLDPEALRGVYDDFIGRYGETAIARANSRFLADVRTHLQAAERRQQLGDGLRAAVPAALEVAVGDDRSAALSWTAATAAAELPMGAGWRRVDDAVLFERDGVVLSQTRGHALEIGDGLAADQPARVRVALSFPEPGERPRLYLFEFHGVGVAVGLSAGGDPLAIVVPIDDLGRDRALQAALQPALQAALDAAVQGWTAGLPPAAPLVIAGGSHELEIAVRPTSQRLHASVSLDQQQIAAGTTVRPAKLQPRLVVMPMRPVAVHGLRIEGQL